MKTLQRYEDMSPNGKLILHEQDDGDIIIAILPDQNNITQYYNSVEFCTLGGGGQSPNILNALRNLIIAIEKDNSESPQYRE